MKTLQIECPDWMADRLEQLARTGRVADPQEAVLDAVRHYLNTRRPPPVDPTWKANGSWERRQVDHSD